jgi:hypothetical protein
MSRTVHVTEVVPTGNAAGASFVAEPDTAQLSPTFGVPRATVAVQIVASVFTDLFAGAVIDGIWLSITVTDWLAVFERPEPSTTVHTTVVVPTA